MTKEVLDRYNFLISEITRHDELYEAGVPEIGDGEYDDLYFELLSIERKNPNEINPNSPSQKVNTSMVDGLEKKEHSTPMLSQSKIKTREEVKKFVCEDVKGDIIAEEKLDGLTIVLEYEGGRLSCATTRGNGYVGEIVTHNLKTFKNVPKVISFKKSLKLRAEAMVPFAEFLRINVDGTYSNPRNLASGTVRQLDSKICAERNMIAKVFEVVEAEGMTFENDKDAMDWVKSLGFDMVHYEVFKRDENILDNIIKFIENYETSKRATLEYMIDGLVFKSIDYKEREELGYTSKWPRWATAFKFKAQEATSVLRSVDWQVGKTGKVTPVGNFDKVNIEVDVERATLNNLDMIKAMGIKIGDYITVIRSNDVIPKITNVIKSKRDGSEKDIEIPTICPICGAKLEINGPDLYCTGTDCQAQIERKLINYASRNAMDIKTLGKETVSLFYEKGFLTKIEDIYTLEVHKKEICELEGFGEKKYNNLIKGIEESKNKDLINLLIALSIPLVADTTAKNIAKYFGDIDNIISKTSDKDNFFEECKNIEDFGPEKTSSLYAYFTSKENINLINFLKSKGISTKANIKATTENNFITGKIFVITGDLETFSNRKALKIYIEEHGGKVSGSVSSKTSYLINNDITSTSGKNKDAKSLGVPIISEADFIRLSNE